MKLAITRVFLCLGVSYAVVWGVFARRCSSGTVRASQLFQTGLSEDVQRFPYAMSAVVTQIYAS